MFRLLMVFSNVIVDINISRQSRAKASAGLTSESGLAVAAFDLVYCSLSVLQSFFVLDSSKQSS